MKHFQSCQLSVAVEAHRCALDKRLASVGAVVFPFSHLRLFLHSQEWGRMTRRTSQNLVVLGSICSPTFVLKSWAPVRSRDPHYSVRLTLKLPLAFGYSHFLVYFSMSLLDCTGVSFPCSTFRHSSLNEDHSELSSSVALLPEVWNEG